MFSAIENSKKVEFANFIYALGIDNVGRKTAKDLAKIAAYAINDKLFLDITNTKFYSLTSTEDTGIKGIIRKFQDVYLSVFKVEKEYSKQAGGSL